MSVNHYVKYRGTKYRDLGGGKWLIIWPSGLSATVEHPTEDAVKAAIDAALAAAGGQ